MTFKSHTKCPSSLQGEEYIYDSGQFYDYFLLLYNNHESIIFYRLRISVVVLHSAKMFFTIIS